MTSRNLKKIANIFVQKSHAKNKISKMQFKPNFILEEKK